MKMKVGGRGLIGNCSDTSIKEFVDDIRKELRKFTRIENQETRKQESQNMETSGRLRRNEVI